MTPKEMNYRVYIWEQLPVSQKWRSPLHYEEGDRFVRLFWRLSLLTPLASSSFSSPSGLKDSKIEGVIPAYTGIHPGPYARIRFPDMATDFSIEKDQSHYIQHCPDHWMFESEPCSSITCWAKVRWQKHTTYPQSYSNPVRPCWKQGLDLGI